MKKSAILILSGPSGAGKSTLCRHLVQNIPDIYFSISTTTRNPREGERDKEHYYFVSEEEFCKDIEENKFLEWAKVHNHYYGTSLAPIQKSLSEGKLIVFDVDVQGHRGIKNYYPNARSVFVTTPSKQVLKDRLSLRKTDSQETIELRLEHAYDEIKHINEFDYLIINNEILNAKEAIVCIAKSLFYAQDNQNLEKLYQDWLI